MGAAGGPTAAGGGRDAAGAAPTEVVGSLVDRDGSRWYRIERLDLLAPFLTIVVSDDDLWAFVSSAGPLTAGRVDADGAVLPYETDDRLHRAAGTTGPITLLARGSADGRELWRPFDRDVGDGCTRALERETTGVALRLEETNHRWGLTMRTTWAPAPTHGWVRSVELVDHGGTDTDLEVLDGLLDVMPPGVDASVEATRSNLVDAYKRAETGPWGTGAIYALESGITDLAVPAEALAATLVWSSGLPAPTVHLDERSVEDVRRGTAPTPVGLLTGRRGAYLLHDRVTVPAGGATGWRLVVDGGLGHAALLDRLGQLAAPGAVGRIDADVAAGADRVRALVASADGEQTTADEVADAHHRSNVLFNTMRGGVFPHGHRVPVADLVRFVTARNRRVAARHEQLLADLPDGLAVADLRARAEATGDADLVRIVHGYLPLTFSRRHGDPSRPWNRFSIRVRDDHGGELLTYEGNWRDIFQNWEALLRSFPAWYPHVVATFLDASTVDGHNPYRLSRAGIDWEVPDPDDPWANIGYWGDHQLVYLLRLLRGWHAHDPHAIAAWLTARRFAYADVPYRLAPHDQMLADPRDTVAYDAARADAAAGRVERVGADGRLVVDGAGEVVHVTMLEKLLVPVLAKLCAYVAGGGIWMNTQRPEWNDANNALVGYGVSTVTLFHLADHVEALLDLVDGVEDAAVELSRPVVAWARDVATALADADPTGARDDAVARRSLLDRLGHAASAYRAEVGDGFDATPTTVAVDELARLLLAADRHLAATVATTRRPDGLVDSYLLVAFPDDRRATLERLDPMLEGQAAAIATGAVPDDQVVDLVSAMFDSALHREDLDTLLLYPAHDRPPFLARNTVAADRAATLDLPPQLVGTGRVLDHGPDGTLHFRPDLTDASVLADVLDRLDVPPDTRRRLLELYEEVFDHHAFTGRSGAMHGYEGLGSVYWHMVSKLLLALLERHVHAVRAGAPTELVEDLEGAYRRVRDGLGFRHDPATFGAIPTDCYSHSPAHAGAQQPGMTGQVKEQVLTRLGELGLVVADGTLELVRPPLPRRELLTTTADGPGWTAHLCGVPVTVLLGDRDAVHVGRGDGSGAVHDGRRLPHEDAAALFSRNGEVVGVTFTSDDPWRLG